MSTTVDQAGGRGLAERLGIEPGMVVQERGWDEDVDDELRDAIVERCGSELVDEDADDVVDVVLLWWREDDGDLVDTLVDALHPLADSGVIWLLTPKSGRDGPRPPQRHQRGRADRRAVPDLEHQRRRRLGRRPAGHAEVDPLQALSRISAAQPQEAAGAGAVGVQRARGWRPASPSAARPRAVSGPAAAPSAAQPQEAAGAGDPARRRLEGRAAG